MNRGLLDKLRAWLQALFTRPGGTGANNHGDSRTKALAPFLLGGLLGVLGGGAATLAGFPAGALVGSSLAIGVAAARGLPVAAHPGLRDLAFAIIGISLGAGIGPQALQQAGAWVVSLVFLTASLVATLGLGTLILRRFGKLDIDSAVLSSSPGTMSNVLAIAMDGRGDPVTVMILQTIRLLSLVALVPPLAALLGAGGASGAQASVMGVWPLLALTVLSLVLGRLAARRGVPAACLLVGMILSAAVHAGALLEGAAPPPALFAAFVIMGVTLGTRLTSIKPGQLRSLWKPSALLMLVTILVSLGFAVLVSLVTGLPLGQVWIAFAPGGVETMAAIALAMGYDPAYVAIHHFARILALAVLVQLALYWLGRDWSA